MSYKFNGTIDEYFNVLTSDMIKDAFEEYGFEMGEESAMHDNGFVLSEVENPHLADLEFSNTSKVLSLSEYKQIKEDSKTKKVSFIQRNSQGGPVVHLSLFEKLKTYEEAEIGVHI